MSIKITEIANINKQKVYGKYIKDNTFVLWGKDIGVKATCYDKYHGRKYSGMAILDSSYDVPQDITNVLVTPIDVDIKWSNNWKNKMTDIRIVQRAIDHYYGDTSRSAKETIDELQEVMDDVEMKIYALKMSTKEDFS